MHAPKLQGIHNVENAMAAALAALELGVTPDAVQRVFDRFEPMEHRIEPFTQFAGVLYVNDSKATNIDSTLIALRSFDKKPHIWLILGGRDKGASYAALTAEVDARCKGVLTIGESMEKIARELQAKVPLVPCNTLDRAVEYAVAHAKKGEIVLLSPACSSFDQFRNFEERGRIFKKLVRARLKQ